MFSNIYNGKKVLLTGNTGFKGSWLNTWLLKSGAEVVGISLDIPTAPSMFETLELNKKSKTYFIDVRNLDAVKKAIIEEKPDFIFHLAAQPIVSISYKDPVETITTNAIGTMNILESMRAIDWPCVAILITSDKSYDNVEWVWGYKETDSLGGKDVYSGSKGAAELIIKSYFNSFLLANKNLRLGVGRAGNVIGGGDWATDRIVVDCMRSWNESSKVDIRCPSATRPWQHVLEPLSGYLALGAELFKRDKLNGETFNFGPRAEQNRTVEELIGDLALKWGYEDKSNAYQIVDNVPFKEASLLKLNCDKALFYLHWEANLEYRETINYTADWYVSYYHKAANMYDFTLEQISNYELQAKQRGLAWSS